MKKILFPLLALLALTATVPAQDNDTKALPQTGSDAPQLSLKVYPKGKGAPVQKSLDSYRGKWLIIEFWGKSCTACILGFPKLEKLRKTFRDSLEVLLIGGNHTRHDAGIEKFYARFRDDQGLGFDTAFDTTAFATYGVRALPVAVLVSPKGKIAYFGTGSGLDGKLLFELMGEGRPTAAQAEAGDAAAAAEPRMNLDSSSSVPHTSSLSQADPSEGYRISTSISSGLKGGGFSTSPVTLGTLYMLANFGRFIWLPAEPMAEGTWPRPLLELSDTSAFCYDMRSAKGHYGYALQMKDTLCGPISAQLAMQADLDKWFGYHAQIQTRDMPVLRLVVSDRAKLRQRQSTAKRFEKSGDAAGMKLTGASAAQLLTVLRKYLTKDVLQNGTQISWPLDLDLDASMISLRSLRDTLRQQGLDLIPAKAPLRVLVIGERP